MDEWKRKRGKIGKNSENASQAKKKELGPTVYVIVDHLVRGYTLIGVREFGPTVCTVVDPFYGREL